MFNTRRALRYKQNCCSPGSLSLHLPETCILKVHFSKWHNSGRGWGQYCLSLLQHYRDMQMLSTSKIQACYTDKTNVQSMNITITREFKKTVCIQSKNKTGKFQNFLRCSFWSTRTLASFQFRHFFYSTMQNTNYFVNNIKAFVPDWNARTYPLFFSSSIFFSKYDFMKKSIISGAVFSNGKGSCLVLIFF